jgi:hypothetical protein
MCKLVNAKMCKCGDGQMSKYGNVQIRRCANVILVNEKMESPQPLLVLSPTTTNQLNVVGDNTNNGG